MSRMRIYTYKKRKTKSRSKSTFPTEAESLESIAHILGVAALFGALWILPRMPSDLPKNEGGAE